MKKGDVTICDCGHEAVSSGFTTGYGVDRVGRKVCFACCGENDRKELESGFPVGLYLVKEDNGQCRVKNWPGTLSIIPTWVRDRKVWNNFAGRYLLRVDVWFVVGKFRYWGFTQGDTQAFFPKIVKA